MTKERANEIMKELKENCNGKSCFECVFSYGHRHDCILQDHTPAGYKIDILDEKEKEYLSNIVKPFRDKVNFISKYQSGDKEFINIYMKTDTPISFPYFTRNKMYKGMELSKQYTLEELDI